MIIRLWTYKVERTKTQKFEEFERQFGVPMVQNQAGCLGVEFFRSTSISDDGDLDNNAQVEYVMISRWESKDNLELALASQEWRDEIALFLSQQFGEQNGVLRHFELIEAVSAMSF